MHETIVLRDGEVNRDCIPVHPREHRLSSDPSPGVWFYGSSPKRARFLVDRCSWLGDDPPDLLVSYTKTGYKQFGILSARHG